MRQAELSKQVKSLERKLGRISNEGQIKLARLRAANKAAAKFKTAVSSTTAKVSRVKNGVIKNRITLKRAVGRKPYAWLKLNRQAVNAMALGNFSQSDQSVSVGAGRNKHSFDDGFFGVITNNPKRPGGGRTRPKGGVGDMHVFSRVGRGRYPLEVKRIPVLKGFEQAVKQQDGRALDELETQLAAELRNRIKRISSK